MNRKCINKIAPTKWNSDWSDPRVSRVHIVPESGNPHKLGYTRKRVSTNPIGFISLTPRH